MDRVACPDTAFLTADGKISLSRKLVPSRREIVAMRGITLQARESSYSLAWLFLGVEGNG